MPSTAFPALLLAAAVPAATPPPPVTAESFSACFDRQSKLVPFSGVALAERGDRTFFRVAGYSDPDAKAPISRQTRFRLASVQKVMTRVAIGQLVQQGRIALEAPIRTYLPGLPAPFGAITVDQLLQHRSGVAPFTNLAKVPPEVRTAFARAASSRERLPIIAGQPLSFRPGEGEEYSNGGYHVLGAIIETVSGRDYGDYLSETLFRPLGMASTDLLPDERTAVRFTKILPGGTVLPEWTAAVARQERRGSPAGDGVSNADDMTRLGKALLGDRLLSPAIKARIFPRKDGPWRIGQSGGTMGTNTDFSVYPETGWVVTILSNYDPPAGELMGEVLRTLALGKGCTPLAETDRVSPMRSLNAPPPPRQPSPAPPIR